MRFDQVFISRAAVRDLVRTVLQCGCPDNVFDDVRIGCPTLFDTHGAGGGFELLVGRRLLVTVVPFSDLDHPDMEIPAILATGQKIRDEQGLNRFRLVIVGILSAGVRKRLEALSASLGERLHLHLLDEESLLRCGGGKQD